MNRLAIGISTILLSTLLTTTYPNETSYADLEIERIPPINYTHKIIIPEVIPIIEVSQLYYDIPLNQELQDYIREESEFRGVPIDLVMAVIEHESNFNPDIISKTNDYGLMQINKCNHKSMMNLFGFQDIMNPYNNVQAGIYILSKAYHSNDGNIHKALMEYNFGHSGAKKCWDRGIYKSEYSKDVVEKSQKYTSI